MVTNETPGRELGKMIDSIRERLYAGSLSYEAARVEAKPVIEEMNRRARAIARRRNVHPRLFSFSSLMR